MAPSPPAQSAQTQPTIKRMAPSPPTQSTAAATAIQTEPLSTRISGENFVLQGARPKELRLALPQAASSPKSKSKLLLFPFDQKSSQRA